MSLLSVESPLVVVGAGRVDSDAYICEILHQVFLIDAVDIQTVIILCFLFALLDFLIINAFLQIREEPAGFLAGLGHQVGIVLVKAEDILRELLHGDFFNDIFDTVFIILVGQVDGQPFARMQGEFPDLARDGITSVHQDSAADAVQGLGAGIHCILSILAILPILAVLSVLAVLAILSGRGG